MYRVVGWMVRWLARLRENVVYTVLYIVYYTKIRQKSQVNPCFVCDNFLLIFLAMFCLAGLFGVFDRSVFVLIFFAFAMRSRYAGVSLSLFAKLRKALVLLGFWSIWMWKLVVGGETTSLSSVAPPSLKYGKVPGYIGLCFIAIFCNIATAAQAAHAQAATTPKPQATAAATTAPQADKTALIYLLCFGNVSCNVKRLYTFFFQVPNIT